METCYWCCHWELTESWGQLWAGGRLLCCLRVRACVPHSGRCQPTWGALEPCSLCKNRTNITCLELELEILLVLTPGEWHRGICMTGNSLPPNSQNLVSDQTGPLGHEPKIRLKECATRKPHTSEEENSPANRALRQKDTTWVSPMVWERVNKWTNPCWWECR